MLSLSKHGTQSERGDRFAERVLTVAATCRLQKRNSLDYMTDAVDAYLRGTHAPSFLPSHAEKSTIMLAA